MKMIYYNLPVAHAYEHQWRERRGGEGRGGEVCACTNQGCLLCPPEELRVHMGMWCHCSRLQPLDHCAVPMQSSGARPQCVGHTNSTSRAKDNEQHLSSLAAK